MPQELSQPPAYHLLISLPGLPFVSMRMWVLHKCTSNFDNDASTSVDGSTFADMAVWQSGNHILSASPLLFLLKRITCVRVSYTSWAYAATSFNNADIHNNNNTPFLSAPYVEQLWPCSGALQCNAPCGIVQCICHSIRQCKRDRLTSPYRSCIRFTLCDSQLFISSCNNSCNFRDHQVSDT